MPGPGASPGACAFLAARLTLWGVATRSRARWADIIAYLAAIGAPALLTGVLVAIGARQREYVFLYMAAVASIAVFRGLLASLLAAALSFFLVDYFFIPPVGTLTIADSQDLVNLLGFLGTARRARSSSATRMLAALAMLTRLGA